MSIFIEGKLFLSGCMLLSVQAQSTSNLTSTMTPVVQPSSQSTPNLVSKGELLLGTDSVTASSIGIDDISDTKKVNNTVPTQEDISKHPAIEFNANKTTNNTDRPRDLEEKASNVNSSESTTTESEFRKANKTLHEENEKVTESEISNDTKDKLDDDTDNTNSSTVSSVDTQTTSLSTEDTSSSDENNSQTISQATGTVYTWSNNDIQVIGNSGLANIINCF